MSVLDVNTSDGPGGRGANNLDALRLLLAIAVIYSHSYATAGGERAYGHGEVLYAWSKGRMTLGSLAVAFFFVLSGYLVTASLMRSRGTREFLLNRARRILPGYVAACSICLAALPLSGQVTVESMAKVAGTFATFGSAHDSRIFPNNPLPYIPNASLWTIPYECWCYVATAIAGLLGLFRTRAGVLWLLCLAMGSVVARGQWTPYFLHDVPVVGSLFQWPVFATYYLAGATYYLWRDRVPRSGVLAAACSAITLLAFRTGRITPITAAVAIAGGYVVLWIGLHPTVRLGRVSRWGDLSYGTYLYAFPIQQFLVKWVPGITPAATFMAATPASLVAAAFSWHLVEKRYMAKTRSVIPTTPEKPILPNRDAR
jgi:peptidoglycan/LPS O-acetylase OafA/YrhL